MINKTHSKQRRRTGSTTRRRTATTGSVPPQCSNRQTWWRFNLAELGDIALCSKERRVVWFLYFVHCEGSG